MRPRMLGLFVAATLAVCACGGATSGSSTAAPTAASSTSPGTPSGPSSGAIVDVTVATDSGADLKFEPAQINVRAETTVRVTFENRASIPHNLSFEAPIDAATATVVEPGASATVEFTAPDPGEYAFVCTLHAGMGGKVVVEAS